MAQYRAVDNYTVKIAPWFEKVLAAKQDNQIQVAPPIVDQEYIEADHTRRGAVRPISSLEDIERFKNYFLTNKGRGNTGIRNYAYFVLALNTLRRCGDLVRLRVGDVLNSDATFKTHLVIAHEQKTGNRSVTLLNENVKEALRLYFISRKEYRMSDWLFPKLNNPAEHMSVDGMRRMLQRAANALGIDMRIGTHSLRKTMPHYVLTHSHSVKDEITMSQLLGHRNIKTTYHYIGRTQDELDSYVAANAL